MPREVDRHEPERFNGVYPYPQPPFESFAQPFRED
jgi:hypothetical protein